MDHHLIAIYELKRQSLLMGYIQSPQHVSAGLAYAYYHRMAPILHEGIARETYGADPFDDIYYVKAAFSIDVLKYLDDRWLAGDLGAIEFYKLEEKFGGYKTHRLELKRVLEYLRIEGKFEAAFWSAVVSNAPAGANSLDSTFSPNDVHFD